MFHRISSRRKTAFTLLELMTMIMILSILGVIAGPAFLNYVRRAKTTEAVTNVGTIANLQVQYWVTPRYDAAGGVLAPQFVTAPRIPAVPQGEKQAANFLADPDWTLLRFAIQDLVYFSYETRDVGGVPQEARCEAYGDLNGDTVLSYFNLSVFGESATTVRKAPALYSIRETD